MPEIRRFHGIRICMYDPDHGPPHFHAIYGEADASIDIATLTVCQGRLPPRRLRLVVRWAALHQPELAADWRLARSGRPLRAIEPPK